MASNIDEKRKKSVFTIIDNNCKFKDRISYTIIESQVLNKLFMFNVELDSALEELLSEKKIIKDGNYFTVKNKSKNIEFELFTTRCYDR